MFKSAIFISEIISGVSSPSISSSVNLIGDLSLANVAPSCLSPNGVVDRSSFLGTAEGISNSSATFGTSKDCAAAMTGLSKAEVLITLRALANDCSTSSGKTLSF